ncbi:MAG: nucleotidyltransferase domain-containing protein [Cyanobacteriota bacterium]|jgi:predicted nucleotidyltransferase
MGSPLRRGNVDEALLRQLADEIRKEIPKAEVRLYSCGEACGYGSRARGEARPDSDIDLLITVTDDWLADHNRFEVLDRLRWRLSEPRRPVDLLPFSRSQVEHRRQLLSSVVHQAYTHGRVLMAEEDALVTAIEALLPPPASP